MDVSRRIKTLQNEPLLRSKYWHAKRITTYIVGHSGFISLHFWQILTPQAIKT
jgi:hypothetical protein